MLNWSAEGYQKILAAGKKGRQTLKESCKKEYEKKLQQYNENPALCQCCASPLLFEKYVNRAKYCSRSCAAKINNKKRAKRGLPIKCHNCAKEYVTTKGTSGKFCSNLCASSYRKQATMQKWLEGDYTPGPQALRKYLKELKPAQCEICSLSTWNNLPIPLEVDHKNGDHKNNQFVNLRFLCPNCHAQTPTYKGKNKGNGRGYRRERWRVGKTC